MPTSRDIELARCRTRWLRAWLAAREELAETVRDEKLARVEAAPMDIEIEDELAALKARVARR